VIIRKHNLQPHSDTEDWFQQSPCTGHMTPCSSHMILLHLWNCTQGFFLQWTPQCFHTHKTRRHAWKHAN